MTYEQEMQLFVILQKIISLLEDIKYGVQAEDDEEESD